MSYVVNVTPTTVPSSTSFVADIGANQENDLIVVGVAWRASGTFTCGSGYTSAATQQTTDSMYSEWFVKKVGASPETAFTISKTGTASVGGFIVYVIRDADVSGTALNAIDAIGSTAGSVGATLTSHALATGVTNTLIIHGAVWDGTVAITDPTDMNMLANINQFCSGVTFSATATTIPTFVFTGNTSTNTGRAWALSIKNGSGGDPPLRLVDGREYIHILGGFGTAPASSAPNVYSTTKIPPTTGIATHNAVSTVGAAAPIPAPWAFAGTSLTINTNLGAEAWVGAYLACTSVNLSGKICAFPYGFGSNISNTYIGTEGMIIVLASSADNWIAYQVQKQSKWTPQWAQTLVIKPGTTTAYASQGSVDLTAIVAIGYLHHRLAGSTTSAVVFHGSPVYENAVSKFIGGGSDGNGNTYSQSQFLLGGGNNFSAGTAVYPGMVDFKGSGQLVNKFGIQYGDGSAPTYINHQIQSYELPSALEPQWRVGANGAGVTIYAASGDTMDFSSSLFVTESAQTFTIHASSSASATYKFSNCTLQGWTVTDNLGIPSNGSTTGWASVAFKSGDTVTIAGGGDLTNCTISKTTSTNAALAITANGSVLDGCTITVADTAVLTDYHLELGTAVTAVTLTDVTFTGTSNSAGSDNVHVLKTLTTITAGSFVVGVHYRINTVGSTDFTLIGASANTIGVNFTATGVGSGTGTADQAVKITISGTTSLAEADVTTAGAPAWVAAPSVTQKVTVSGITTGARVQIYDTTSSTELFNGTATAGNTVVTGSTVVWTDPLAASANRAIRIRVSYVSGATAKNFIETSGLTCGQTAGTAEITYPVSPTDDTVYNANAITGSGVTGVTFTDAATDVVNINVVANAISWKTIYAAWVYYVFGATGIASDIDYIDAVDEANYILSNLIIKNTSSPTAPLEVTGGYGRDFTTGATIDLADTTGGTLIFAPDHVVSYAVGSGVTAQDITDIAAASGTAAATATLAAAQTTPIHSDVRKVVGITVDGNGQTGTEWGPA